MKLRTEINIKPSREKFTYKDKLFFIGSCFTDNIGRHLQQLKFNIEINPFGVIYNPLSVKKSLELIMQKKEFKDTDLHYHNDLWFSYFHHSSFSSPDQKICLNTINKRIGRAFHYLKKSTFLFITFGTSWIYQLRSNGEVVSNCHKVPADQFDRSMVSSCDIFDEYKILFEQLFAFNPHLQIVLTLSPVRHLKDGFVENQHSKANLLMAMHQMKDFVENISYFPAYEIVMDDLRDYRFYADDLVHPNDLAVDYIWDKFRATYIQESEAHLMKSIREIVMASQHKAFHAGTKSHQNFVKNILLKIEKLEKDYPYLDFEEEKKLLEKKIQDENHE